MRSSRGHIAAFSPVSFPLSRWFPSFFLVLSSLLFVHRVHILGKE